MNYKPLDACSYLKENFGIERTPKTLQNYRSRGGGPRYLRPAPNNVLYPQAELDLWAKNLLGTPVKHTAEEAGLPTLKHANRARAVAEKSPQ